MKKLWICLSIMTLLLSLGAYADSVISLMNNQAVVAECSMTITYPRGGRGVRLSNAHL